MAIKIRHIATRFAFILAGAAAVPLAAYGIVSFFSLQSSTRESVTLGNSNVAKRAAEEIRRYIATNADILKELATTVQGTGLTPQQQDHILKKFIIDLREFKEVTLFDESGAVLATSRISTPGVAIPQTAAVEFDNVRMSSISLDTDGLPTALFAIHLKQLNQPDGWLVGEFSLEEMWRTVDQVRLGEHGYALVVSPEGKLIAHGDPDQKALVAQSRDMRGHHPLVATTAASAAANVTTNGSQAPQLPRVAQFVDESGREQLAVSTTLQPLNWTVIVEQPTSEAYAGARRLRTQLIIAISLALLVMVCVGWLFGRQFIAPIFKLQDATRSIAKGDLQTRVQIGSEDEFGQLGEAFNTMAGRLVDLQENVKRQERQAMFGRLVAGLVHDINHPVMNIGNSALLLMRDDQDEESRTTSFRTLDVNVKILRRLFDDILNISRPKKIEPFPLNLHSVITESVDAMRPEADRSGVALNFSYPEEPLMMEGDRFALGRVLRNLIINAIQATKPGGSVSVIGSRHEDWVTITVADTGSGIPPDRIGAIFDDFVTTKSRGLGLGLAISKQTVEQHGGTISVESEVGRGTSFTLRFPARDDLVTQAAAS